MTKSDLSVIVGLFSGTQAAMAVIVESLDRKGVLPKVEIASSLRVEVDKLPPGTLNHELVRATLRLLADGIEGAAPRDPSRPLLTLIRGGK